MAATGRAATNRLRAAQAFTPRNATFRRGFPALRKPRCAMACGLSVILGCRPFISLISLARALVTLPLVGAPIAAAMMLGASGSANRPAK